MNIVLASTHHDPDGRLYNQAVRVLPKLLQIFGGGIAVQATYATQERSVEMLRSAGVHVRQEVSSQATSLAELGTARRATVELALRLDAPAMMFGDFDRLLHWAEFHPHELADVAAQVPQHDFVVFGRTERAFHSHPRVQTDTEAIINHVFVRTSGLNWDVTAAARGMSRRAAAAILEGCFEHSIGTDVAWPLFVQQAGNFQLAYIATEGLEFETADRFSDEVAAAGGVEQWIGQIDADPGQWAFRLDLARVEVAAAIPYNSGRATQGSQT